MSPTDIEFLRDVQGFIEFGIRNGLSFPAIVSTLGHDINNIARQGFDWREDGFGPKVAGYSKLNEDDLGESEETRNSA